MIFTISSFHFIFHFVNVKYYNMNSDQYETKNYIRFFHHNFIKTITKYYKIIIIMNAFSYKILDMTVFRYNILYLPIFM